MLVHISVADYEFCLMYAIFLCHIILFLKQQQQSSHELLLLLLLRLKHSFSEKEESGRVSE